MFVTYAQNFEDVMLWRALGHIKTGFYVDVGAYDPVMCSVSKAFYDRGWRGVHVEPVAVQADRLRQARPDEIVVQKCLGARSERRTLHIVQDSGLSTLVEKHAQYAEAKLGFSCTPQVVDVVTLEEVLAPHQGRDIHWLKIDVEGAEKDVLSGWDCQRDRPWVMVVEATMPNSQIESHHEWEPLLIEAEYRHVYFDGINRFYVAHEHEELAKAFRAPPNAFDEFLPASLIEATEAQTELAHELERCRAALQQAQIEKGSTLLSHAVAVWTRLWPSR